MRQSLRAWALGLAGAGILAASAGAAPVAAGSAGRLDVVATAHLDTQWRWTIKETVDEYLRRTLEDNFTLLERHPDYVFTFEGAFRYQLMKEYYPEAYQRLKGHVAAGRWRVAGGWLDAVDVNIPSPESLYRHALYANAWYQREFGLRSRDVFLPDCFGFGWALPTVARHSGLVGFSTQKLGWGCAVGTPFDIGLWEGVDGSTLVAALNPGSYSEGFRVDLSQDSLWMARAAQLQAQGGPALAYKYFGTGDTGGAPDSASVAWLERSVRSQGPLQVRSAASDQLMVEMDAATQATLPRYRGELLMTRHGAGCYTSQAAMKRLNRANEVWGDAAERSAAMASWMGLSPWPAQALENAWTRMLWHQFHDDLTGTSIPEAYTYSWSDELLSLNQFGHLTQEAVEALAGQLDTRPRTPGGRCLVLFNPLGQARSDEVRATLSWPKERPAALVARDARGREWPVDLLGDELRFPCQLPPLSVEVVELVPVAPRAAAPVEDLVLRNERLELRLGGKGVMGLKDLASGREWLTGPMELQLLEDSPRNWPAWEVDYDDMMAPPLAVADGARWCREGQGATGRMQVGESTVELRVRLGSGEDGALVELELDVDWRSQGRLLKAAFPLACAADSVTYDLGCGVIRRGVNHASLYEVPGQRWADLGSPDQGGVAIISTGPAGWDHPAPGLLRLSLVRTPEVNPGWRGYGDQATQDLGRHQFRLGLFVHPGDWRQGVAAAADAFNQPVLAYEAQAHAGSLGRTFSLFEVKGSKDGNGGSVQLKSLRKALDSQELVLRLQEMEGRPAHASLHFAGKVMGLREVNAAEEPIAGARPPRLAKGVVEVDFQPFQPRTLAIALEKARGVADQDAKATPLELPFTHDVLGARGEVAGGSLPGTDRHLPSELLPQALEWKGLPYRTGPREPGLLNALACQGQGLELPAGEGARVHLLVLVLGSERAVAFPALPEDRILPLWSSLGAFGQWDSRMDAAVEDASGVLPAWVKEGEAAWVGTHLLDETGAVRSCETSVLYHVELPLSAGERRLVLPVDKELFILAATVVTQADNHALVAAFPPPLRTEEAGLRLDSPRRSFADSLRVGLESPTPGARLGYRFTPTTGQVVEGEGHELTVRGSGVLEAWANAPGMRPGRLYRTAFTRLELQPALKDSRNVSRTLAPGLWRQLRTGAASSIAQAVALPLASHKVVHQVELAKDGPEEDVALFFEGFLQIPATGVYRLMLSSDDGSALWLDGACAIDNDGLHGPSERVVERLLEKGLHPLRVDFFQHLGGAELRLEWERPDGPREPLPAEFLFHKP